MDAPHSSTSREPDSADRAPAGARIEDPRSRLLMLAEELRFKRLMKFFGFTWLAAALGYVLAGAYVQNSQDPACAEIRSVFNGLMVIGLAIKVFILAMLSFAVMGDVRRARLPVVQSIVAHAFTLVLSVGIFGIGFQSELLPLHCIAPGLPSGTLPPANVRFVLTLSVVFDLAVCWLMFRALHKAERAQYPGLRYFTPLEFEVLAALADVLILANTRSAESAREVIDAGQIASNVEHYFAGMRGRAKARLRLALAFLEVYPLRWLHPPFSLMNSADRYELLKKHLHDDVLTGRWPRKWLVIKKTVLMAARQLVYIGYYNDPATFSSVHYLPFEQRERFKLMAAARTQLAQPQTRGLVVERGGDIAPNEISADVVVVGTGAGASVLAHELVRAGHSVLMLERGPHVRADAFTSDEIKQMSALYSDGALQMTKTLGFQVLQGRCVGGTTEVNNAISFDLPAHVLERWNRDDEAGIDPVALGHSFDAVKELLHVQSQHRAHLNPGGSRFVEGIRALGLGRDEGAQPVPANISDCLGCGYCNIGCKYGRKLSMTQHVLPLAQAAGSLRIIAGCDVRQIVHANGTATGLLCELDDDATSGKGRQPRTLSINARTIFVAGGAISSSVLLLRSGLGNKNTGQRLSFNIGAVMTGQFSRTVNAFDGLQMSHYCAPDSHSGMLLETWFNPPMAQSLTMPGWFADHFGNMRNYHRMMCVGALFGSDNTGQVSVPRLGPIRARLLDRARQNPKLDWLYAALYPSYVHFEPGPQDVKHVVEGLKLAGTVLLEAGAQKVMPNSSFKYLEFGQDQYRPKHGSGEKNSVWSSLEDLQKHPDLLLLGSAHPQGGNAISKNPAKGVVDENFRVHGCTNVYVTDASVFPSSVGVNPQLTVMALAHLAAHKWIKSSAIS